MIAELSFLLGQTWEHVEDTITMARLTAYRAYFLRQPPTHVLAAGWMGYKPPPERACAPTPPPLPDIEE